MNHVIAQFRRDIPIMPRFDIFIAYGLDGVPVKVLDVL